MIHLTKFMSLNFINEERIIQHHVLAGNLSLLSLLSLWIKNTFSPFFLFLTFPVKCDSSLSHTMHTITYTGSLTLPIPTPHTDPLPSKWCLFTPVCLFISVEVPCTPVNQPAVTDCPARCNISQYTPHPANLPVKHGAIKHTSSSPAKIHMFTTSPWENNLIPWILLS